jgi:hypothetical protein
VFCGEEINLDNFMATMGPPKEKHTQNIAGDPYRVTKFFHFLIRTVLTTLFGVETTKFRVKVKMGIFGQVWAYFGVVESQNCGSTYWCTFRLIYEPLHQGLILRLMSKEHQKRQTSLTLAWSTLDFDTQQADLSCCLARAKQVHTCEIRHCLIPNKQGHYKCKCWAPFETFEDDFMDMSGKSGPKQVYEYFIGWNPSILLTCHCNNVIKLLTNSSETWGSSCYITGYATKKQNKHHNLSGIMAKGYTRGTQDQYMPHRVGGGGVQPRLTELFGRKF